jgi:hypothetical protein
MFGSMKGMTRRDNIAHAAYHALSSLNGSDSTDSPRLLESPAVSSETGECATVQGHQQKFTGTLVRCRQMIITSEGKSLTPCNNDFVRRIDESH